MNMTIPKPNLDDRTFTQLVDDARKLIPRYAPLWTDHNLSDPGITFLDLFAWLTEITLYRINLINDSHRLKYLTLLGFRPKAAAASNVDLTFESNVSVSLPAGTVATIDGRKMYFELYEDMIVAPLSLARVIVDAQNSVFDRTSANNREKGDLYFAPFGMNPRIGDRLYLGFDNRSNAVPAALGFMCYLYESDLKKPGGHGDEPDYIFRNENFEWEYIYGGTWKSIAAVTDGTEGFRKSGRFTFGDLAGWESSILPVDRDKLAHLWLRCTVKSTDFEYPPRIETIVLNTISATHGLTILDDNEERVSTGMPWQVFKLREIPVLDKTLDISVDGTPWKEVEDFDGSSPADNHYVLDKVKGEILFGDGLKGRVPEDGTKITVPKYRVGGGKEGNVKANLVWKIKGHDELTIWNNNDAVNGMEEETIDEATLRFLRDMRVPYTTVTSDDFEKIAVNTPGLRVAKARAIANYYSVKNNGDFSSLVALAGSVTLVVLPFTPLGKPPVASPDFISAICRHVDKHRLIGTEIHVIPPMFIKVEVSATIVPSPLFPEETLKADIIQRLNGYIHPITGGKDGNGWPIGENVSLSEIYELIEQVDGVNCVTRLSLSGDKGSYIKDGNLILPSLTATVYSGSHKVTIETESDRCRRKNNGRN